MSLTPKTVLFAALVAALGIISTWNPQVIQSAWKLGLLALALGLIYEWVYVNRVWPSAALEDTPALKLGRLTGLWLQFTNPSGRAIELEYAPAIPEGLAGSRDNRRVVLAPAAHTRHEVMVRSLRLGTAVWDKLPARVLGPLGLARWSGKLPLNATISIGPDTLGDRRQVLETGERGAAPKSQIGTGMELHHLRPYRKGDPPGAIDWKATARSGELITRVFGEDQHLEIIVVLDAGRTSRLEMDGMAQISHYVNLAARFAEYAAMADDRVGLVVFSDRVHKIVQPQRGIAGVRHLRDALGDLQPDLVESDLMQAAFQVRAMARQRSLVVLLTSLYDRGANDQLARFVRALSPKHLPIVVGITSEEVRTLAEQRADDWFDPYLGLAAQEHRRDLAANAALLTRLGAYAVTTRPRALDAQVMGLYDRLRSRRLI